MGRRSPTRARRDVLLGQVGLLVFLGVAIALFPGMVLKWNQAGLSNYGVHAKTVVPYSLALALGGGFSIAGARSLPGADATARRLRLLLDAYGGLMVLSLLSTYTYKINALWHDVHVVVNVVTALFGLLASLWLYARLRSGALDTVGLAAQLAGFACAVVDFAGVLHVLFTAQALSSVGFGVLLVRGVTRATHSRDVGPRAT